MAFVLWETVILSNKNERLLNVPRTGMAECNACGHKFRGTQKEILEQFRQHNCDEDTSQAALRVVRESTEGK